jgi:hypothetical protein
MMNFEAKSNDTEFDIRKLSTTKDVVMTPNENTFYMTDFEAMISKLRSYALLYMLLAW